MNDRSTTKPSDRHLPVPEMDEQPKAHAKAVPPKGKSYPILKPPKRREPRIRNAQELIEDANAFAEQVDLTRTSETQDPSLVEKGQNPKQQKTIDDVTGQADGDPEQSASLKGSTLLSELDALTVPKTKPPLIIKLERLLQQASTLRTEEKQPFVDKVNKLMDTLPYCFEIGPKKEIAKKLYFNDTSRKDDEDGDIQFQLTSGDKRGFVRAVYTIQPYSRPYTRKQC